MKLKEAFYNWLLFDVCLTVFLLMTVGVEGLAQMACTVIDHENCEQFE